MARKTVDVSQVREWVNARLASKDSFLRLVTNGAEGERDMTPYEAFRLATASLYEQIAHATGNYHGFGYQSGVVDFSGEQPAVTGDETRRIYY